MTRENRKDPLFPPESGNPIASRFHGLLRELSPDELNSLFILDSCLARAGIREGRTRQELMGRWIAGGLTREADLRDWMKERFLRSAPSSGVFDKAAAHAVNCMNRDIHAFTWDEEAAGCTVIPECPRILFASGDFPARPRWAAVFNSRKQKLLSPGSDWLRALRQCLPEISESGFGLASSTGTLTYDLVTAYARRSRTPSLLVLSSGIDNLEAHGSPLSAAPPAVACTSEGRPCPKPVGMLCRDRLLALLADVHVILEIREGGNLSSILQGLQTADPRPQQVFVSHTRRTENRGNFELIESFPQWSIPFSPRARESGHRPIAAAARKGAIVRTSGQIAWNEYLYHYTRARPGPWPGQSHEDYLYGLLDNQKGSAHTALDALASILCEGLIRGGAKLVRGTDPVVSWTSRHPGELLSVRKWNPALIRWTFEPYGVAVRKSIAKAKGAKPAIYGGAALYPRIGLSDRFRYQRHEPPRCLWKSEREWRSRGDFALDALARGDGFIFVPRFEDCEEQALTVHPALPVVVLEEYGFPLP